MSKPKEYLLGRIWAECEIFNDNVEHESARAKIEQVIIRLNQLTGQYIEEMEKEAPPILGISVGDGIGMGERIG